MNSLQKIEDEVSTWSHVTVHAHRFGGREFRFGKAEVGHVHVGGPVDIPFPRPLHDALLANRQAEEHRWVPNSGWITFNTRGDGAYEHAVWLLRLSYLRYALKESPDPRRFLEQESRRLHLTPQLKTLLEQFIPHSASAGLASGAQS